jgi:chemotaxis protein MotB
MICYGLHVGHLMPTTKRTFFAITLGVALLWTFGAVNSSPVRAQDASSVRLGEAALTFAAGSIRQTTPQDGVVNPVSGDNQTSGNRMLLGEGDSLYLRMKPTSDVSVGDLYTIFKRARKVLHPGTGRNMGYVVIALGIVRVVQVDHELITATVVIMYGPISPGDPVVRFVPPAQGHLSEESRASSDVHGVVLDLQSDRNMFLVARQNVVYLDRGREDGLRPGDFLEVFRISSGLPRRVVGELKVLSTEDRTATALISRSTSQILRGDRFTSAISSQNMFRSDVSSTGAVITEIREGPARTAKPKDVAGATAGLSVQQVGRETHISLDDLVDQLEYETGEVVATPRSFKVLNQIVEYLKANAEDKLIRVEGHADNVEIGPSLKTRYPTNWELSKARATGIIRYLVEKGGLDSAKLSAIGYGDTRPVASNSTEEGRRKNRRVEIIFSSPEPSRSPNTANQPASQEEAVTPPSASAPAGAATPAELTPPPTADVQSLVPETAPGAAVAP